MRRAPHARALLDADDLKAALRRLAGVLQAGILSEPVLKMRDPVAAEADTHPAIAADYVQRSWDRGYSPRHLTRIAEEGVQTFLSRYLRPGPAPGPARGIGSVTQRP